MLSNSFAFLTVVFISLTTSSGAKAWTNGDSWDHQTESEKISACAGMDETNDENGLCHHAFGSNEARIQEAISLCEERKEAALKGVKMYHQFRSGVDCQKDYDSSNRDPYSFETYTSPKDVKPSTRIKASSQSSIKRTAKRRRRKSDDEGGGSSGGGSGSYQSVQPPSEPSSDTVITIDPRTGQAGVGINLGDGLTLPLNH